VNFLLRHALPLIAAAMLTIAPARAQTVDEEASVKDVTVTEGNSGTSNAVFTVSLTYAQTVDATVHYATANGSATAGSDYTATSGTLTIPAGHTTATVSVPIVGDTTAESTETFTFRLSNPVNAVLIAGDGHSFATGTILDNDGPVTLSVGDASVNEGDTTCASNNVVFTATLSQATTTDVDFIYAPAVDSAGQYAASPGGPKSCPDGGDYLVPVNTGYGPGKGHAIIPAGQTSVQFSIPTEGDQTPEFNETFLVNLSSINFAAPARTQAVGTIVNDDGIAIAINNVSVSEGNSGTKNMVFTVSLNQPSASSVSVDYATADGTAKAGTDYTAKSGTLTIPFGQTSGQISVAIVGDTTPEFDKTFYVNLSNPVNAPLYKSQGVGTIVNDDALNLAIVPAVSVGEANTQALFTVNLSAASASDVTFHFATANGTATVGSDYVATSGTATISAGQTSVEIPVTIKSDTAAEADETFFVNISSPTGAVISNSQSVGTILNNDGPRLSIGNASRLEGNSGTTMMSFPVTLDSPASGAVTVSYSTANGTGTCGTGAYSPAIAGIDYVATSGTATIPTGQLSTTINVSIIGNLTPEAEKGFCVNLGSTAEYATVYHSQGIGTILNDDGPLVSLSDASLTEGNSGTPKMVFTATLSQASTHDITVYYSTADGTAQAGSDYNGVSNGSITIGAGKTTAPLSVFLLGDTTPETNETLYVNLAPDPRYARIGRGQGVGTIVNDDGPVLSISDASTLEGNSGTHTFGFTVSLSQPVATDVTFQFFTSDGTATGGSDYVARPLTNVTIPAGQTQKVVFITVNGDTTPEPDETFFVNIGNAVGATIVRTRGTGTILDDDDPPTLSVNDVTLTEGNSGTRTLGFTVTLSHPWTSDVSYKFATADGTATAGSDYVARTPTNQTILAGSTSRQFFITINGDTVPEDDETFFVNLSSPTNATILRGQGTGTIIDDDEGALMAISAVQGPGDVSPMLGKTVSVAGIVTARTADGFMLQMPDGANADARASRGIFISTGSAPAAHVVVGAKVLVTGVVQEATRGRPVPQMTMTQIAATRVKVTGTGQSLPEPVVLGPLPANTAAIDQWERFEGMRVSVPALTVTGPVGGTIDATGKVHVDGRFYGVPRGTPRPFREPGIDALDRASFISGMQAFDDNPERLMIDSRNQIGASGLAADAGDTVTGLVGVLGYGDGAYQVWPDRNAGIHVVPGAIQRPVPVGGTYTIGQLHLGALVETAASYPQRLAKTANAICAYTRSPAILGVQDVVHGKVLSDLASAVNSQAGNVLFPKGCANDPAYQSVNGNGLGFLVSTAEIWPGMPRVQVLSSATLAQGAQFKHADGSSESLYAATPLLLQARLNAKDGDALDVTLVAASLLPMEGVDANAHGTHGWKTQGAYVRAKRQAQALWLANWLQARQASHPTEKLVVLGGFNATQFNDGYADLIGVLTGEPATTARVLDPSTSPVRPALFNLTQTVPTAQRYNRIWQGNAEATDHILVNRALLDSHYRMRVDHARLNADFGLDNDDDFQVPLHTAMNDPMVLSLDKP